MSYHPLAEEQGTGVTLATWDEDEDGGTVFLAYPGDEEHSPSSPSPSAPKMPLFLSLWVLFLIALLSCGPPYFAYHAPGNSFQNN